MRKATGILVLTLAMAVLWAPSLSAVTLTLQQGVNGYAGTTDAWLDESLETDNYGGAANLRIQYNNGRSDCVVLKFDLAGLIPSGSVIVSATLSLWYYGQSSMGSNNAVTITPYRLQAGAWWDENIYDGQAGVGVSYQYRDVAQLYQWTGGAVGGWWDKIDDANGTARIKDTGGTPVGAIEPGNWVPWNVTNSVTQWYGGATNHGFLLVATGFEGSGYIGAGLFISRNDTISTYRPKLVIVYDTPVPARESTWSGIKALYR